MITAGSTFASDVIESVFEPDGWSHALAKIKREFDSEHVTLFTNGASAKAIPLFVANGLEEADISRFTSPHAFALWTPWQKKVPAGQAIGSNQLIADDEFDNSDFYNDIVRPSPGYYAAMLQVDRPSISFHLSVCRAKSWGSFNSDDLCEITALSSSISLALYWQQRLKGAPLRGVKLETVLDHVSDGVILLDGTGKIAFQNIQANRILESDSGLQLSLLGLRAHLPQDTARLSNAIAIASAGGAATPLRLQIVSKPGRLPLQLCVLGISSLNQDIMGQGKSNVAIFIKEAKLMPAIALDDLIGIFGLTQREALISFELAKGKNLDAIALGLRISVGTIRYHLKHVFEKVNVHSQIELVATIWSLSRH